MVSAFLTISIPVLLFLYAVLDFYGALDEITGRFYAIEGLERLSDTGGYPTSWIMEEKDERIFSALYSRITKNTRRGNINKIAQSNMKPSVISVGGAPIPVKEVPDDWEQNERFYYSENYPILFLYHNEEGQDKAIKACTLGDLRQWIRNEKEFRDFWFNAFLIGLLSVTLALLQV